MKFNVAQLLKGPSGAQREYELDDDIGQLDEDIEARAPLTGKLRLTRTANGILATAKLHTVVTIECRRCTCSFASPVEVEFAEEFFPTVDVFTGAALASDQVEEALRIDQHHMLDLTEIVRQHIILQREQYPLCDEACAGLCPICGKNLNEGPCGCQDLSEDPRWSALRELLE